MSVRKSDSPTIDTLLYILNDYISDYKSRLIKLQILPLAYILELNDIMFFIRNLKHPHEGFNINNYILFGLWR